MAKQVVITVEAEGTVAVDYQQFVGTDCLAAGKQLHNLLAQFGVAVHTSTMTPKPELGAVLQQHILPESQVLHEGEEG